MPRTDLHWGTFRIGKGHAAAAWTDKGLCALVLPGISEDKVLARLREYLPPFSRLDPSDRSGVPAGLRKEVREAFCGKPFFWKEFDLFFLTPFQRRILEATARIPRGQYRTYGWVARKAGCPGGSRAAGQALNRNPIPLLIPCHRVIAAHNRLGGYGGGLERKVELLRLEGLEVQKGLVTTVG